jgi:hypothetical protein
MDENKSYHIKYSWAESCIRSIDSVRDVEPNETTNHLLLPCISESGDIKQATEIVSIMKSKGFPVSEPIFTALVLRHARDGQVVTTQVYNGK